MSSFRIDRQYVSFEAAEIHPANLKLRKSNESVTQVAVSTVFNTEEIEKQRVELLKQTQKEANEKAQLIINRARAESEEAVRKARLLAEEILLEAEENAKDIKERAEKRGFAQGMKTAEDSVELRKKEDAKVLHEMMDKLRADYSRIVESINDDVASLAMEIVKKIIGIKLDSSDEIFLGLIGDALGRLKQAGFVTIHVSSEDYARYFGNELPEKYLNSGSAKITVVEEEDYAKGDLVLESDGEALDFSIGKQIEIIEKAFTGEGN